MDQRMATLLKPQFISISSIFSRFRWRISLTLGLVSTEAMLAILYPLLMGIAIDDLLAEQLRGVYWLVCLGLASLVLGSLRRFYDTRLYARIYRTIAPEMVQKEKAQESEISTIAARTNLLTEFMKFFEDSIPGIINAIFGLLGVLLIIFFLSQPVFIACVLLLLLTAVLYMLTGKLNYAFNTGFNDELERQVSTLDNNSLSLFRQHLKRLMGWNIRLSDLETLNFFFIWFGALSLLIFSIFSTISSGQTNPGLILALLMYVYDYIEKITSLPLYIQQLIRLKEISSRLE